MLNVEFTARQTKTIVQTGLLAVQTFTALLLFRQAPASSSLIGVVGIAYTLLAKPTRGIRSLSFLDLLFLTITALLTLSTLLTVVPEVIDYWSARAPVGAS